MQTFCQKVNQAIGYFLSFSLFSLHTPLVCIANEISPDNQNTPEIIVDQSSPENNQFPTLDLSQNNTPILNITNPNSDGISKNNFTDYNVLERGLIINNSINYGTSQLGGAIYGNPNYNVNGTEASIILNQVTGLNYTKLLGYSEIFGKTAELIIANPNGIFVSGGGFINTAKLTLAASDVEINNKDIIFKNYITNNPINNNDIPDKGMILISGTNSKGESGLDASNINNVSLISRALHIAKKLTAKDNLQIATGMNDVKYQTGDNLNVITRIRNYQSLPSNAGTINTGSVNNQTGGPGSSGSGIVADATQEVTALPEPTTTIATDLDGNTITTNTVYSKDDNDIITMTTTIKTDYQDTALPSSTTQIIQTFTPIPNQDGSTATQIITTTFQVNQDGTKTKISQTSEIKDDVEEVLGSDDVFNSTDSLTKGDNTTVNASTGNAKDIPAVAIDTYNLGGIYANKIFIIATENGVASRFASQVIAQDSMNITLNGDIIYNNLTANNDINISTAANVKNMNVTDDKQASTYISSTPIQYTDSIGNVTTKSLPTYNNSTMYANNININASNITNNGLILSKNDINMSADIVNNEYGSLISKRDINLGKIVNNTLTKNTQIINKIGLIQANNDIKIQTNQLDNTRDLTINSNLWTGIRDIHPGYSLTKHLFYDEMNDPRRSYIISDHNININATTLNNIGSTISAANDVVIIADKLNNQSIALEDDYKNYYMSWEVVGRRCSWHSFITGCENIYGWRQRAYMTYDYRQEAAQLAAGRNMIINAATELNNGNVQGYADYNQILSQNSYQLQQTKLNTNDVSTLLASNAANMFNISKDPSSNYVIETNPLFTNVDEFKGSKYLFDRLGIDFFTEETRSKRLIGDAYWENNYLKQQILEQTGKRFLSSNITSDQQQLQTLYENAIIEGQDLRLTIGVELTKDQIANLKKDIIWYTTETITLPDGTTQSVLKPKLYLSKVTQDNLQYITGQTSSIISSNNDLTILNTDKLNITNTGQILSNQDLTIFADSITNKAITDNKNNALISGNNSSLISKNDIINKSGTIAATETLNLVSIYGNIISETDKRRTYYDKGGREKEANEKFGFAETRDYKDNLSQQASIIGNNINVFSGKDTLLIGSSLTANNDLNINTQGNFIATTRTLEEKQTKITGSKGFFSESETINIDYSLKNVGSNIFGNDVNITSNSNNNDNKSNITIYGSNLNASGDVSLLSNGDTNILSSQDYSKHIYEKTETKMDFGAAMAMTAAGAGMGALAGSVVGGAIVSAAIAMMVAPRNATVETIISESVVNNESTIIANNLTISSGNDINLASSKVDATNDISLLANNNINIYDQQDVSFTSREVVKETFDWSAALFDLVTLQAPVKALIGAGKAIASNDKDDFTNTLWTPKYETSGNVTDVRQNVITELNADNINIISKNDTTIFGTNLTANEDINILSHNDTTIAAQEQKTTKANYQNIDRGLLLTTLGYYNLAEQTTNTRTNITSQNINMSSGYDVNGNVVSEDAVLGIIGSSLNAENNIGLLSSGEINISSAQDINHIRKVNYQFDPDMASVLISGATAAAATAAALALIVATAGAASPAAVAMVAAAPAIVGAATTVAAINGLRYKSGVVQTADLVEVIQVSSSINSTNTILISGENTNITASNLTSSNNIISKVGTTLNNNDLIKTNPDSMLNVMSGYNTSTATNTIETQMPDYLLMAGVQFGTSFVSGLFGGAIGANSGALTTTFTGQLVGNLVSGAVAAQATELLVDWFNCGSNTGCQIGAALLGGAVGGLAGWKVGNAVDDAFGVESTIEFSGNDMNLFKEFINITLDKTYQPFIATGVGALTNPTGMLESTSSNTVVDSKNTKIDKEVKSSLVGNSVHVN